jgi:hypothetical protein
VGAEVTLAAITSTGVYDIASADLTSKKQRIQHAVRMIKISSLLVLLERVIGFREFPELDPVFK